MKFSIDAPSNHYEKIHFKQDDNGVVTTVYDIIAYKLCPHCGNPEAVRFDTMSFRNANNHTRFPYWCITYHECNKCHDRFKAAVIINKEKESQINTD